MLATPDAGQITSSSQQSFTPKRFSSEERYPKRNERPSFDYKRPFSGYDELPTEPPVVRYLDVFIDYKVSNTFYFVSSYRN